MSSAIFIYLHGFLSSPRSVKAQQVVRHVHSYNLLHSHDLPIECRVPEMPEEPHLAFAVAEKAIKQAREENAVVGLLGSSMGGFYATVLAERYDLRAVLINPSVRPHLRFEEFVKNTDGVTVNPYTQRRFALGEKDIDALATLLPAKLNDPEKYWLLAQMGDEVLDYREAVAYYAGSKQTIEAGGDHSFQGFERYLPDIMNFLNDSPH